ncbi:MAG: malate dehydrogenase [Deltaproteobacteria bacterium]|nr:malate dehydrogenase [Deltaproteobacteria bacterium]
MKLSIIGAGQIGGVIAFLASIYGNFDEVFLYDVADGLAEGKSLDINHGLNIIGSSVKIAGSSNINQIAGSDIIIITAGVARKPGMSRDDLLFTNADIVISVASNIKKLARDSIVIVVTNPLDAMTWLVYKTTGFTSEKVVGMAGILDSSRYCFHLAEALSLKDCPSSAKDIHALVLGGHGDDMVPVRDSARLFGTSVTNFLDTERMSAIENRVRQSGAEIVGLLKTGSAFFSPAVGAYTMAKAIIRDENRFLAASCLLNGEYGIKDIYFGVPCILGREGVKKVVEVEISPDESDLLKQSASRVRGLVDQLRAKYGL